MSVIKLRCAWTGGHVEERVFVGWDEDHLALAGTLMLDIGQYQEFGACLLLGADRMNEGYHRVTVQTEAEPSLQAVLHSGEAP